jgi:hypothetical protein
MHVFEPRAGVGPLLFGSTPDQVAAVLGKPSSEGPARPRPPDNAARRAFLKRIYNATFETSAIDDLKPDLQFFDGKLVLIHLFREGDSVSFQNMDVLRHPRLDFVNNIYKLNQNTLTTKECIYFSDFEMYISRHKYIRDYNYCGFCSKGFFEHRPGYAIYKSEAGPFSA